ncbi:MAG TPA: methyltransferase domain-containing protein [Burkholderiaceae bacterium]|nr:methyltransferase domain-containing protein [Burkholderiaceae bacterium]
MPAPSDLDRAAVRRQFDRRAATPDPADFLLREVERRMLERLDLIRIEPARVLDVGCGLGDGVRRLRGRWPSAEVIGVDLSPRRAARAAALDRPAPSGWIDAIARRLGGRGEGGGDALGRYLAGDAHRLPIAGSSVDLVWSSLAFHWFDDVPAALAEWYRVVRPGGLLMFSAFGVDTFAELRAAGLELQPLPDLHDIGDALVEAGFAEPVMDVERFTVTWTDPRRALDELRGLGGDARRGRPRGLATPRARDRALAALDARRAPGGPLAVGVELIQGHAWCGAVKRRDDGYVPIRFERIRPAGGR